MARPARATDSMRHGLAYRSRGSRVRLAALYFAEALPAPPPGSVELRIGARVIAMNAQGARWTALAAVLLAASGFGIGTAAPARGLDAELPAVARPQYRAGGATRFHSTVFFIPAPDEVGVAAVGAAHSFDLGELGDAEEVRFLRPASEAQVSLSSRYLVKPGRPFRERGGTLRGDYIVFALDMAPTGVRVLEPEPGSLDPPGSRVRILGIPNELAQDEDDVFGTVVEVTDTRMEVDLDVPADLRGWGGAPVVSDETGRVLGILQGAWPVRGTYRVGVAPIHGVLEALERPLAEGLGQPLSYYAEYGWELPEARGNPFAQEKPEAPALPPLEVARRTPSGATGDGGGTGTTPPRRYLEPQPGAEARLRLKVEYPEPGGVVGNPTGGFLAGHAMAVLGEFKKFDVVFVIDTSGSTSEPTGQDINGNGQVGQAKLGGVGTLFGLGTTDPGDSILAAEIMAARQLLQSLDPRSTRVAVVSFAGVVAGDPRGFRQRVVRPAVTEEPLTTDYQRIDAALSRIFQRGPDGMTHMAAGVDQATIELLGLRGALSQRDPDSDKVVLFFTDGQPTLPYEGLPAENVRAVLRAAERARRGSIRIHSFALGPSALEGPIAPVEMASITEGYFTPVRSPGDLVQVVEIIRFTDIEAIEVRNLTTEQGADHVQLNADGSWSALVPLAAGRNRLEVVARADDGRSERQELELQYAPGETDPEVPRQLVTQRNRLLERKLLELRRGRIAAERAAAEAARKELLIEIERERATAAERAARQRKELELSVEEEGDGAS